MNIFIDIEAMRFVTGKELRQEFEQLKREQPEEYDYTFEQYIQNCTSKNGTLKEVCVCPYGIITTNRKSPVESRVLRFSVWFFILFQTEKSR